MSAPASGGNRLVNVILRYTTDRQALQTTLQDNAKVDAALEKQRQQINKVRESYERLAQVSQITAAAGASILAPLTLAANKYVQAVGMAEETSIKWQQATARANQAQVDFGRKAAESLLPYVELLTKIQEEAAKLPAGVLQAGAAIGVGLSMVGAAGLIAAQVGKLVTAIQLLAAKDAFGGGSIGGNLGALGATALGVGAGIEGGRYLGQKQPELVDKILGPIADLIGAGKPSENLANADIGDLIEPFKMLPVVILEVIKEFANIKGIIDLEGLKLHKVFLQGGARLELGFDNLISIFEESGKALGDVVKLAFLSIERFLADISIKDPTGKVIDIEFDELLGLNKNELDRQIEETKQGIDLLGNIGDAFEENNQEYQQSLDDIDQHIADRAGEIAKSTEEFNSSITKLQKGILEFTFGIGEAADNTPRVEQFTQATLDAFDNYLKQQRELEDDHNTRLIEIEKNRQQSIQDLTENFNQRQADAQEDFDRNQVENRIAFNQQLSDKEADYRRSVKQALISYQKDQLELTANYYKDRAETIQGYEQDELQRLADFNLARQRAEEDHRDKLKEAAGRLDAIAVLNEIRGFNKDQRRGKEDFDKESNLRQKQQTERLQQLDEQYQSERTKRQAQFDDQQKQDADNFARQQAQDRANFAQKEADAIAAFNRQRERENRQYQQQLVDIDTNATRQRQQEQTNYDRQRQQRETAFNTQLNQLRGFNQREMVLRQQHYQQLDAQLRAFIQQHAIGNNARQAVGNLRVPLFDNGGYGVGGIAHTRRDEWMMSPSTTKLFERGLGTLTQSKVQSVIGGNRPNITGNTFSFGDIGRYSPEQIKELVITSLTEVFDTA